MGHNESQGNVYIELVNEEQGWNRGLKCDESGCDYGLHLKIMGGHTVAKRYLGQGPEFPDQDTEQGRILLSEIVASVAAEYMVGRITEEEEANDWHGMDAASYTLYHRKYTHNYLRIAHGLLVSNR